MAAASHSPHDYEPGKSHVSRQNDKICPCIRGQNAGSLAETHATACLAPGVLRLDGALSSGATRDNLFGMILREKLLISRPRGGVCAVLFCQNWTIMERSGEKLNAWAIRRIRLQREKKNVGVNGQFQDRDQETRVWRPHRSSTRRLVWAAFNSHCCNEPFQVLLQRSAGSRDGAVGSPGENEAEKTSRHDSCLCILSQRADPLARSFLGTHVVSRS